MSWINGNNDSGYNFVAPSIEDDAGKRRETVFPTAEVVSPSIGSNIAAVAVRREKTIVKLGMILADTTLKLDPNADNLNVGAVVIVNWESQHPASDVTVVIEKTTVAAFEGTADAVVSRQLVWDGETFLAV